MVHKEIVTAAFILLASLAPWLAADVYAQDATKDAPDAAQREDQLKAAYLFNFLKFIDWPSGGAGGLTVCFAGASGVRDAISSGIENKRVGGRRVYVRSLETNSTLTVSGCDVLYLDAAIMSAKLRLPVIEAPLLTVSDAPEFARNGGMIELFTESNRLRFNINVDTARRAGLRISSSLLQLAAGVEKGGGR